MLTKATMERIEPFFDIMCTYLRSAMTHIDSRIQEDSLLFLDVLLLCTPERIARDFHKIIPNFLDMISKLRVDSKPGRTLTVNLDSQISSVKWRVKVLHRLQEFLHKYLECNNIGKAEKSLALPNVKFDGNKVNYYPLLNTSYTSACRLPSFYKQNSQLDESPMDDVEKFKTYFDTLMPLLFETWLEVCPNANREANIETVVNEDAAGLLKHSLQVIASLWELVKYLNKKYPSSNIMQFFSQKYRQPFCQHIFKSFPYVTNLRRGKATTSTDFNNVFEDTVTDPKLVLENLQICHLFVTFNPNVNVKLQNVEVTSLLNYIERTFNQNSQDLVNDSMIKILQTIFSSEITNWTKDALILKTLFEKLIWAYFNQEMSSNFRQKIFALLCQIAMNDKLLHFHQTEAYEKWLSHLPDILLEDLVTVETINIILKFASRNNKVFNNVVKPKLVAIINNLPKIKVAETNDESIYKLFSLLYWIKCWDDKTLNLIEKLLVENAFRSDHGKYIFDTLRLRSVGIYQ